MVKRGVELAVILGIFAFGLILAAKLTLAIPGYVPPCNPANGGVQICGLCYDCGAIDGVCPELYGKICSIADGDCNYGNIVGTVTDDGGSPLEDVFIEIVGTGIPAGFYVTSTDAFGVYNLTVPGDLTYDVIATKPLYEPTVKNVTVPSSTSVVLDFTLSLSESLCKADCTRINNICDADCDYWNGCRYNSTAAKLACNGRPRGFIVDAGGQEVVCCIGYPSTLQSNIQPQISVRSDNMVTTLIPALLGGDKVKVVVAMVGNG